jgi:predicted dehydrogenase
MSARGHDGCDRVRCAVVGCGEVSSQYLATLRGAATATVVACHDLDHDRGADTSRAFGVRYVPDLDEALLSCDLVINLTPPSSHAAVGRRAIEAGRSVYNEKPLAADLAEATLLLEGAEEAGVLVGCAPDTFLAAPFQAARRAIDGGCIGEPVAAAAAMLSAGHERWHPEPQRFYQHDTGPLQDMGPYYLTVLVFLLGPVRRVAGAHAVTVAERTALAGSLPGRRFTSDVPTHVDAVLEFVGGPVASLVTSFDVKATRTPHIEVYGTGGTLVLPDPNFFDGPVWLHGGAPGLWSELPRHGPGLAGRGLGVVDLAHALVQGTPQRASGRLGLHVLEVMIAVQEAAASGHAVPIRSSCPRPAPLPVSDRGGCVWCEM